LCGVLEYIALNEREKMQFFHEMFDPSLLRLGPGTEASTLKAIHTLPQPIRQRKPAGDGARPRVLDLGCGTGAQSLVLAREFEGPTLAVDNYEPYLDALRRRAAAAGVSGKILTSLQDMRVLEFDADSFDVIWSEGAIFIMGFCEGLVKCRRWLAPGGFLALTEICWLKTDVPAGCRRFLEGVYPSTMDIDGNLAAIRERGYTVVDHFTLPKSAWAEEYYKPLEQRLTVLRGRCARDAERLEMLETIQAEIDAYRKYSDYYGYVFYILRR
jgi:cyclopropane fatty-acyl-phospholipid synthase-like methyltransferase